MSEVSARAIALRDEDYRFGFGPILVRAITILAETVLDDDSIWLHVRAEVSEGTVTRHGPWMPREFHICRSAFRAARPFDIST